MNIRYTAFLCSVGFALVSAAIAADPPNTITPVMKGLVENQIIAGSVTIVVDKDSVLELDAVGYSSIVTKRPMQTDDLFWIASMTKPFTGTALMMLVDEGKVRLDDPVEKYLPEFKDQFISLDGTAKQMPEHVITVREAMCHTAGLVKASDPVFRNIYLLKDWVAKAGVTPLIREPGTKYEYNNVGINIGGRIIEVVSGMSYADFLQRRLLDPLGMKDTTFWPNEEQARRLARSVRLNDDKDALEEVQLDKGITPELVEKLGKGVKVPEAMIAEMGMGQLAFYANRFCEPAGSLFSTAPDLGVFCQLLLNGGVHRGQRLLSEDAIRTMTSNQTGSVIVTASEGYGVGWSIKIRDDEGIRAGSFGHRGARRTAMWIDPKSQIAMIVLVERFDMSNEEQKQLYGPFMKAAVTAYGKPTP